jgi:cation/acetate symporter
MSMLWKGLTTRGAVIGGWVGLVSAVALTIVSPGIWEAVFGYPKGSALFPYTSPAIFTIPLAFVCCWLFSKYDNSASAAKERAAFEPQFVRSQTGIGAEGAVAH